jgi:hypothetical protein
MFYALYPFVTYLLTLPRTKTRPGRSVTCRLYRTQNVGQMETGPGKYYRSANQEISFPWRSLY